MRIHPVLAEVAAVFSRGGKAVYLVGGAVRDMLRGKEAADWDLATDALPEEVISLFRPLPQASVIPTGLKHGTVTIRWRSRRGGPPVMLETTTFRTETAYSDARRPDTVTFTARIEDDLVRRDFTMNSLALSLNGPRAGRLVDVTGGREDIRRGLIRCVGCPAERFAEDGLRPLRALRFAAQLGFDVEERTLAAIPSALEKTALVSAERVRDELEKTLAAPSPLTALRLMERTGLLALILPELARCRSVEQRGYHTFDVLDHSFYACEWAARTGAESEVRLAALLHDIGKPLTRRYDAEREVWTFYNHEAESATLTRSALTRLRFPHAHIERVAHLVICHMFHYEENWSDAAVRRFVSRAGEANLDALFRLRLADAAAISNRPPPPDLLLPLINRIETVLAKGRALGLKDLAVNGRDLLASGVESGKRVGILLNELLEAVQSDPALNTRETLLAIVRNRLGLS